MRLIRQAYFAEKNSSDNWEIYWDAEGCVELVCTYRGCGKNGSVSFAKDSVEPCTLAVENVMAIFDLIKMVSMVEVVKGLCNES